MIWLRLLLCLVIVMQAVTYGTITPLIPFYAAELDVHASYVGWLTGAYTAGMIPACVWLIVSRRRRSEASLVLIGLAVAAAGCLVATAPLDLPTIIVSRFLMGFGSATSFSGAIRWLVASAPLRTALLFGIGWGMLSLGNAVGPVVGALAVIVGPQIVSAALGSAFIALFLVTIILAIRKARSIEADESRQSMRQRSESVIRPLAAVRNRRFLSTLVPLVVPGAAIGALFTLVPLRLAASESVGLIAVTFALAAAVGAAFGPIAGHICERIGVPAAAATGLFLTAGVVGSMVWPVNAGALVILTVSALGVANQVVTTAIAEELRRVSASLGIVNASATFLPLLFAVSETAGALLSTSFESDVVALGGLSAAALGLAVLIVVRGRVRP